MSKNRYNRAVQALDGLTREEEFELLYVLDKRVKDRAHTDGGKSLLLSDPSNFELPDLNEIAVDPPPNSEGFAGYMRGLDVGAMVYEVRLCALFLAEAIADTASAVLSQQGYSHDWQIARLRILFEPISQKPRMDKRIVDAVYDLRIAVRHYEPLRAELNRNGLLSEVEAFRVPTLLVIASEFRGAIFEFLETGDLEGLHSVVQANGGDALENLLQVMRETAPKKTGPKGGTTPVVQFILDETRRLDELHGHDTDGTTMLRFIKELSKHPDVKQWLADLESWKSERSKHKQPNVSEYSVYVQAYMAVDRFKDNQILAGDYLRDKRRDARERQK